VRYGGILAAATLPVTAAVAVLLCCCGLLVLEMMTDFEVVLVARTRGQHVNIFDGYLYGIEIPWVEDIVVVAIFRGVR
jgi:hypothetical protein